MRLALAEQAAGRAAVVINADSAQVYADLAILSARPSPAEMQGVPHRLFGAWDGAQACSAADWAQAATAEIDAAHAAGAMPILVGGTGLYIRTLLDGIAPIPAIDPAIRAAVRALPVSEAYAALYREDPARAAALNPGDSIRVARALEVVRSTGQPLAHWQARREGGIADRVALRPLVLLPDRAWLYARCDQRFAAMWEQGAQAEVAALLARQLDPDLVVAEADGLFSFESGIAAGMDLLARDPRPTAIFATNDDSAAGVMVACARAGLRVPHDISLCGFDDSWVAKSVWPYLTTIYQPIEEMGYAAASLLLDRGETGDRQVMLDFHLVEYP